MRRIGVAAWAAVALLIVGIVIGVTGFYVATTYQTKTITDTKTVFQTTTTTQISFVTTTSVVSTTTTQISTVTSTSTSLEYPTPMNVTVLIAPSGQFMDYSIQAGSFSASGSLGSPQSFSVSPVFQNEQITISITLSCPGSTGPTGSASLYVNGTLASKANVACGGNTTGQISYVL